MDITLVHGNFHGAWCWDFVQPELERLGHRVTAVDLPITDPALGASAYAHVVETAIDPGVEPVLVAHSMAGLVTPLVAVHRPVRRLVFLAALLPLAGTSAQAQRSSEPIDSPRAPSTAEWTDLGDDVWSIGANTATELFFHDVPSAVASWATRRLRPQSYRVIREVTPLAAWPDVECRAIACADDRAVNPDWVRSAARDRLGVEAVEIPGGHSPFLARPRELARLLHELA